MILLGFVETMMRAHEMVSKSGVFNVFKIVLKMKSLKREIINEIIKMVQAL